MFTFTKKNLAKTLQSKNLLFKYLAIKSINQKHATFYYTLRFCLIQEINIHICITSLCFNPTRFSTFFYNPTVYKTLHPFPYFTEDYTGREPIILVRNTIVIIQQVVF